ncbi:ASCH domain-containing protein (plasmid) [Lysinibacillus capsici]|uniref:ASCH domain-containing protein n=1 Tax=Lysinibacillus capsici TaxID=2115968 RepID=UPI0021DAB9EA|nr:ASCH domain-containing protein [Lysinibacillus capsici]UYB50271.1 ASCH domain-containing protein [Lysinibacillus capsici]
MKALTIKQPWATLIALGEKNFETRSWQTKYRGPLAIHAGKSIDKDACEDSWIKGVLKEHGITSHKELQTGVVLATVELVDCYRVEATLGHASVLTKGKTLNGLEVAFGDYTEGRYAWELANLQVLPEPMPAKGQLSLWEWNKE